MKRIAWALACTLCACNTAPTPAYVFDSQAVRPISARLAAGTHSPQLGVEPNGAIALLAAYGAGERTHVAVFTSVDGGDTFARKTDVSDPGADVEGWGEASPAFAVTDDSYEHVVWEQERAGRGELLSSRMRIWKSEFEKSVPVSDARTPTMNSYPSIAVAGKNVYATWLDGRQPHGESTLPVYIGISHDGGATFTNRRVSNASCPCCRPAVLAAPDGTVYVAWRWVFPGEMRDMVVAASPDGGMTFGKPTRVHADGWSIKGCPEAGPSLAFFDGALYIAWHTVTPTGEQIVDVARSTDGAKTFSLPELASRDVLDANHPRLVATRTALLLVFEGRDPSQRAGWGASRAYFASSAGATFSPPQSVSDGTSSVSAPTVLARDEATVYIVATETDTSGSSIVLFRGRRSVGGVQ